MDCKFLFKIFLTFCKTYGSHKQLWDAPSDKGLKHKTTEVIMLSISDSLARLGVPARQFQDIDSEPSYEDQIQEVLDLFSNSYIGLGTHEDLIDSSKREWSRILGELKLKYPNPSTLSDADKIRFKEETAKILAEQLPIYHTLKKATAASTELFEKLTRVSLRARQEQLAIKDQRAIAGFKKEAVTSNGIKGDRAHVVYLELAALSITSDYVQSCAIKVDTIFQKTMTERMTLATAELEALIKFAKGETTQYDFTKIIKRNMGYEGYTTEAYQEWTKTKQETELNLKPWVQDPSSRKTASEVPSTSEEVKLDEALAILNVSFVDPKTKVHYGAKKETKEVKIVVETPVQVTETHLEEKVLEPRNPPKVKVPSSREVVVGDGKKK